MSEPISTDPAPSASKKGLSPLAWVAIGCGALVLIGFIAFFAMGAFVFSKGKEMVKEAAGADSLDEFVERMEKDPARTAAEMAIRLNPDLEIVTTDESAGTITFKNVETGESWTLDFEDIAAGRFGVSSEEGDFTFQASDESGITMTGPEGEMRLGGADLADLPSWVHLYPNVTSTQSSFHSSQGDTLSGAVTLTTTDAARDVIGHYREWLEDEGWTIQNESSSSTAGVSYAGIIGEQSAQGRTLNVSAIEQQDSVQVTVNYSGKRDQ